MFKEGRRREEIIVAFRVVVVTIALCLPLLIKHSEAHSNQLAAVKRSNIIQEI